MKKLISFSAMLGMLAFALVASAATTVVTPSNMQGWGFLQETATGSGSIVSGPAGGLGNGSANLVVDGTGGVIIAKAGYNGTLLSSLTTLEYSTYRTSGSSALATALQFNFDGDVTDLNNAFQGRIIYEPYHTQTVSTGVWESWDAMNDGAGTATGNWWFSNSTHATNSGCAMATPCTWAEVLLAFPNGGVHNTLGAVILKAGGGWAGGFDGNVDALTIGVSSVDTTFDFEPDTMLGDCVVDANIGTLTYTLLSDCTTDETILVTSGWTLDGDGYTITAVDPAGGHFLGAIVRNAGAVANVTNLTVTTDALANVCDAGDDRLRGIMFDGASGNITNNTVIDINQGPSGCQEGNAIEVRNAPFDNTGNDLLVTISGNTVSNYIKNGITANGSVAATITDNVVTGSGPVGVPLAAQNGIQIGFGATANVVNNTISGNDYTPKSFVACGLLMFEADGVKASKNVYSLNERDVCNFGKGGGQFNPAP